DYRITPVSSQVKRFQKNHNISKNKELLSSKQIGKRPLEECESKIGTQKFNFKLGEEWKQRKSRAVRDM
ncbi:hypothetical protein, partial [Leptospira santarosai]|uniref:hypothetical protein n=1 Tax=Leptospira santarosai TaxID=28183 RepID=UPI001B8D557E